MKSLVIILVALAGIVGLNYSLNPAVSALNGFDACDGVASNTKTCTDVKAQEGDKTNPVTKNLKIALNILAFIAGAAAVVLLIVNGLRLILSNGDSNGVSSARGSLIYVVIGIVVVILAQSIVVFLLDNI